MSPTDHTPCVMTNTDSFYFRICDCGVIHLCFGATTLNLSPEALIAVSETLKEVSAKLKSELSLNGVGTALLQAKRPTYSH